MTPAIITIMSRAAERAAKSLLRDFYEVENLQVSMKGPKDFVSAADTRAEELIHAELSKAKPKAGFLMEESGEVKGEDDTRFIVDPLDGTSNFLHGIPHWCISIAYEEAGKVTAGLILDPIQDEMFYATQGQGAWMRGNKRLRVSGRKDMGFALVSSHRFAYYAEDLSAVKKAVAGVRSTGSAALSLAYVAAGRYDAYFEGLPSVKGPHPWDVAAGQIIVREAGGYVSEINGGPNYIEGRNILAGNEKIYGQMKDLLAGSL